MLKKLLASIFVIILLLSVNTPNGAEAAAPIGVKWGNSILIKGQIGKVTILKDTDLIKEEKGKLVVIRKLKKGNEFRVYSYKDRNGGIYGLGGGAYVKKNSSIKYETPSPTKKKQIERVAFFDKSLLSQARKGVLKGQPITLNYHTMTDVFEHYNTYPSWEGYYNGGYGRKFGNYVYFGDEDYDSWLTAVTWWNDDLVFLTPHIIRNTVGKPTSEGISDVDHNWYMYYDCGSYSLYFQFEGNNRSNLYYIMLKQQ